MTALKIAAVIVAVMVGATTPSTDRGSWPRSVASPGGQRRVVANPQPGSATARAGSTPAKTHYRSGVRASQWQSVDEAIGKGLPKSAAEALRPIIEGAIADHAWAEATRAVGQRIALEANIHGNKPEEKIRRMQAEIARAPAEMRPMMEAILGEWFWQYFRENRWRFLNRTRTSEPPGDDFTTWDLPRIYSEIDAHFTRALAASELLKRTPIAAYDDLIDAGSAPDAYRPTLYDFVAYQALAFYTSGEQAGARPEDAFDLPAESPILAPAEEFVRWRVASPDTGSPVLKAVRLYQDLLRFHGPDEDPAARIDADLWRLQFAKNMASGDTKGARYKAALEQLADRYADHELSARACHEWALALYEEGDWAGAWRIARRGEQRFPGSVGGRRCYNLIHQIEAPSLSIATERVWNEPLPTIDVRYRNLGKVYFRIVSCDLERRILSDRRPPDYLDREELEHVLEQKPALRFSTGLPETKDFRERLERLPAPEVAVDEGDVHWNRSARLRGRGLAPGSYYLIASPEVDFPIDKPIQLAAFWVSDLALVWRTDGLGGVQGLVLNATKGDPLAGIEVHSWHSGRGGRWVRGPTARTDRNGAFSIHDGTGNHLIVAGRGKRRLAAADVIWTHTRGSSPPFRQTVFFTDRALYRPGQTIQYKGLCIDVDQERDRYEVLPGQSLTAVFTDANGKEIAR